MSGLREERSLSAVRHQQQDIAPPRSGPAYPGRELLTTECCMSQEKISFVIFNQTKVLVTSTRGERASWVRSEISPRPSCWMSPTHREDAQCHALARSRRTIADISPADLDARCAVVSSIMAYRGKWTPAAAGSLLLGQEDADATPL